MNLSLFNANNLVAAYKKKNYVIRTYPYRLNIFGIRDSYAFTNLFVDAIGVFYYDDCNELKFVGPYNVTTLPGKYWMEHPMNTKGCGILVPGQYQEVWAVGLHKGEYKALVQVGNFKVWRDKNDNDIYDTDDSTIDTGSNFCIELHHAADDHISYQNDKWSAACQVMPNPDDHANIMLLADVQVKQNLTRFDYTLFMKSDILS